MDFFKLKLVEYGFSFIVAPLAVLAVQLLKRYSYWLESLKAWPKRAFVAVTVAIFVIISQVTGVDFGVVADQDNVDFLANLDTNSIKVALGSGLAYALYALKKITKKK